ncbi:hypothetical protein [Metarhizobium album]|nr:hypothetical protein [Rhizobium album]
MVRLLGNDIGPLDDQNLKNAAGDRLASMHWQKLGDGPIDPTA